jgi:hypothetical protein
MVVVRYNEKKEMIVVRSKMLLTYNILPATQEEYMQFMMNVFIPLSQRLGLENVGVWHTAYGNYPLRLLAFVAEEKEMRAALVDARWKNVETRLRQYVTDYVCRVIPYEPGFQF